MIGTYIRVIQTKIRNQGYQKHPYCNKHTNKKLSQLIQNVNYIIQVINESISQHRLYQLELFFNQYTKLFTHPSDPDPSFSLTNIFIHHIGANLKLFNCHITNLLQEEVKFNPQQYCLIKSTQPNQDQNVFSKDIVVKNMR